MYMPNTDSCVVLGLAEKNSFYSELLPQVQATADEIKKIAEEYEWLIEQCRKKFGGSISQQLCKRKKKRNLKKERRKAKKVKATPVSNEEMDNEEISEEKEVISDGELSTKGAEAD